MIVVVVDCVTVVNAPRTLVEVDVLIEVIVLVMAGAVIALFVVGWTVTVYGWMTSTALGIKLELLS